MTNHTDTDELRELLAVNGLPHDHIEGDLLLSIITAHTNKQIEAVLDRLEATKRTADLCTDDTYVVKQKFIEAERNKLNNLYGDVR